MSGSKLWFFVSVFFLVFISFSPIPFYKPSPVVGRYATSRPDLPVNVAKKKIRFIRNPVQNTRKKPAIVEKNIYK